jgi:ketosteroid isomerase-like protein
MAAAPPAADEKAAAPESPAHQQMRDMRMKLVEAFNKNDIDGLLAHVDPNATVTWQDGVVSHGHKGIREYHDKMMKAPNHVVESVSATVEPDELSVLRGDREGISYGKIDQHFKLTDGREFDLKNRYTAELIKDGDDWKVATLHVSANVFDNPIQQIAMKQVAWWSGGIGAAVGLLLGVIIVSIVRGFRRGQP